MPEEIVMVSTCPLCGGPEEVPSMVTVEIDRIIPKVRATIVICRSCAGAVIRAVEDLDVPLLSGKPFELVARAEAPAPEMPANYPCVMCGKARTEAPADGCSEPGYHEVLDGDPSTD